MPRVKDTEGQRGWGQNAPNVSHNAFCVGNACLVFSRNRSHVCFGCWVGKKKKKRGVAVVGRAPCWSQEQPEQAVCALSSSLPGYHKWIHKCPSKQAIWKASPSCDKAAFLKCQELFKLLFLRWVTLFFSPLQWKCDWNIFCLDKEISLIVNKTRMWR